MLSLILTFTLIVIIFMTRKKLRITSLNKKKIMTALSTISLMISQKPKTQTSMIEMEMPITTNKISETIGNPFDSRTLAMETKMFQDTFKRTMNVVYNNRDKAPDLNKAILDLIKNFA